MKLTDPIAEQFRLNPQQKSALTKLGIKTIRDLLYHLPHRYEHITDIKSIHESRSGEEAVLFGTISNLKTRKAWKSKRPIAEANLHDGTGTIKIIWFNQPYLAKMVEEGAFVKAAGKITGSAGKEYLANPEIEPANALPLEARIIQENTARESETHALFPIYPESRGVTSKWFYHALKKVLKSGIVETLEDALPREILKRYNLPDLATALVWIHAPQCKRDAEAARKRFAFEEIFSLQLAQQKERKQNETRETLSVDVEVARVREFTDTFKFDLTGAQTRAIETILSDFKRAYPMARLLEGDVGSGKTAVAAATMFAVVTTRPFRDSQSAFGNLQVAYMAPTEILAKQHFESFIELFSPAAAGMQINIGLITSSGAWKFPSKVNQNEPTKISKNQLLKWVANGEIPILVGTHSLIQKNVRFENLAYVIIDEQHRFGVSQRLALARRTTQTEAEPESLPTQNRAESKTAAKEGHPDLLYTDLAYKIRGAVFNVRKKLGNGHAESVYQKALAAELLKQGISFQRGVRMPVMYGGKKVGSYQPDFLIDKKVIIELKVLPRINKHNQRQTWDSLRGTPYKLALIINFGSKSLEIKRIVYDTTRENVPRESASDAYWQGASLCEPAHRDAVVPHLLSMTATPIPRTLALTIYGDLDLTLLDEMPKGRKPIKTEIVPPKERAGMYATVHEQLDAGRQAYVICPRIDEPDPDKMMALNAKSVTEEAERLKRDIFPQNTIGILHGKMSQKEKDAAMQQFLAHEIDILVATSVVEVGVNVPNATVIVIEGAERFGLAQLHQLRGRVIRSTHQAYCYVLTESKSAHTLARLRALKSAKNGFELAEKDLKLRGAGELAGKSQSGISDVGMEALRNLKMVEAARAEAAALIDDDADLKRYPRLKLAVSEKARHLHLE